MKIRTGFVSNSSSSSFLLIFDKKPTRPLDVLSHIWPNLGMIGNPHDTFECFPVSQAAEAVWEQIKDQKPKTKDEIIHSFANSWESYGTYDHIVDWKECQKEAKRRAPELAKEFLDKAKKKFVYQVEFSDDSSFGSTMEHGDVFRNIDHKRFNNH